ncbi:MAG: putative toxin-antitoxin system toxin component, PIN family [Chloroflexota bacterium]|nr:putative toxin-antitoxin system toxin component, PIN family [Chloroflexota bacterium]
MRVVLDTNIFISAILGGRLRVIIDEWKAGKFTLIITDAIAREYIDVIKRPRFKIPPGEIVATTDYLLQTAEFVTPEEEITVIVADLTDNKFLEAAVAGKVNFIVSGDDHVLELKSFREIPILTAREFVDWLENR